MQNPFHTQYKQVILHSAEMLLDEATSFLQGLLRIPTINPPGNAYPECATYIGEHLRGLGYAVEYITLTPAEVAELAPDGEGLPRTNMLGRLEGSQRRPVL